MEISITGVLATQANLQRLSLLNTIVQEWFALGEHDTIMQESFEKNFAAGGRPAWEPLAQITVEVREALGFSGSAPILVRTGNFMDEITSMESTVERGLGETIARWGIDDLRGVEAAKFKAHTTGDAGDRTIPIRRTIGFQEEDKNRLIDSLGNFISRQFV